eukprot:PhM_4_TR11993/c0_g1_i1/m.63796
MSSSSLQWYGATNTNNNNSCSTSHYYNGCSPSPGLFSAACIGGVLYWKSLKTTMPHLSRLHLFFHWAGFTSPRADAVRAYCKDSLQRRGLFDADRWTLPAIKKRSVLVRLWRRCRHEAQHAITPQMMLLCVGAHGTNNGSSSSSTASGSSSYVQVREQIDVIKNGHYNEVRARFTEWTHSGAVSPDKALVYLRDCARMSTWTSACAIYTVLQKAQGGAAAALSVEEAQRDAQCLDAVLGAILKAGRYQAALRLYVDSLRSPNPRRRAAAYALDVRTFTTLQKAARIHGRWDVALKVAQTCLARRREQQGPSQQRSIAFIDSTALNACINSVAPYSWRLTVELYAAMLEDDGRVRAGHSRGRFNDADLESALKTVYGTLDRSGLSAVVLGKHLDERRAARAISPDLDLDLKLMSSSSALTWSAALHLLAQHPPGPSLEHVAAVVPRMPTGATCDEHHRAVATSIELALDRARERKPTSVFIHMMRVLRSHSSFGGHAVDLFYGTLERRPGVVCSDLVAPLLQYLVARADWSTCLDVCRDSFVANTHSPTVSEVTTLVYASLLAAPGKDAMVYLERYRNAVPKEVTVSARCVAELNDTATNNNSNSSSWLRALAYLQATSCSRSSSSLYSGFRTLAVNDSVKTLILCDALNERTMKIVNAAVSWSE